MTRLALWLLLALPVVSLGADLQQLLDQVEKRYNRAKTLQVSFEESLTGSGPKRVESGELALRKPGRMRWDYRTPAGKLFVSDGKNIYYYSPTARQAEKMKLKESEDMRAPLAFLLGRLDFEKDFRNFQATTTSAGTLVKAFPKSDKLPYKEVEFLVTGEARIAEMRVVGYDQSLLTFRFSNERLNPTIADTAFQFQLPAGAAWAQGSADGGSR